MLFKDELIISLRQSKVRRATGAPRHEEPPSKGLKVKKLCWMLQQGSQRIQTDVFASLAPFV